MSYRLGRNPCGLCKGRMHDECDVDDCTCSCKAKDDEKFRKKYLELMEAKTE